MHHSFDIHLAAQLGSVELAILVHHFQHWIKVNQAQKINFHEGRTWTYQTREAIAAHFPYLSAHKVRRLTDRLVELKILRKGNFNRLNLDKTIWYAFENEEIFTIGNFAKSIGNFASSIGNFAKAIPHSKPNSETTDIKDLGLETLASHKNEVKNLDVARRWKLSESQLETFEWLKNKGIDADDAKLAYWAKVHSLQRLMDVYNESIYYKARSLRVYMGKLLDEQKTVHNARIQANSDFAKDFAEANQWNDLKIFKKYVKFRMGNAVDELSLDMESNTFVMVLMNKFELTQRQNQ